MRFVKLATAKKGNSIKEKIAYTLDDIRKDSEGCKLVKLIIYVDSLDEVQFEHEKEALVKMLLAYYKDYVPAYAIIPASNIEKKDFVIEYEAIADDDGIIVRYKKLFGHHYTVVEDENKVELFSGGISFKEEDVSYSIQKSFDLMEQILDAEGMLFDHVYLQRNYVYNLSVSIELLQQIQEFYYGEAKFLYGIPFLTEVGIDKGGTVFEFGALKINNDKVAHSTIGESKKVNGFGDFALLNGGNNEDDVEKQVLDVFKTVTDKINQLKSVSVDNIWDSNVLNHLELIKIFVNHKQVLQNLKPILKTSLPEVPKLIIAFEDVSNENMMLTESFVSLK